MPEIDRELLIKNPMGPVRITMPAHVAYNNEMFKRSLVDVLEELGCRACFSGADCTFQMERELVINPRLDAVQFRTPTKADTLGQDVTVRIRDTRAAFEIDNVFEIVDTVLDRLGCLACCSGFDITFRNEIERVIQPEILF